MGLKGFQGTSLLDYPGRIASLLFWGGCNLTCPFCHNPPLVLEPETYPDLDLETLLEDLSGRKAFIDGVVVSGGEPTLQPELAPFLLQVKALGLLVKLDTNALAPDVVADLLERRLIDYLAIDLKTSFQRYPDLHPAPVNVAALEQTVRLALKAEVELEFRTTCVPGWVDQAVICDLGEKISGAPLWAIQQYHPEHALDEAARQQEPFTPSEVESLAETARGYVDKVIVRGL